MGGDNGHPAITSSSSPPPDRWLASPSWRAPKCGRLSDIDLRHGLNDTVRNGYEQIRVSFMVKGNAPAEKLRELVEQSRRRSAVFDVITNSVPVTIDVTTA